MYLAVTCTNKDRVDNKLQGLLPRRKTNKNDPPTVLTSHTDEVVERWWYPMPPEKLTREQKKLVMACVVEQMVRVVFSTHYYEWEGVLFKHMEGGPIGLRASGPVARIIMDYYLDSMKTLAERTVDLHSINPILYEKIELRLIQKYVDDVFVAADKLRGGTKWCNVQKALLWSIHHLVKTTFSTHYYEWEGVLFKQMEGGPI